MKNYEKYPMKWNLNIDLTTIFEDIETISYLLKEEISLFDNKEKKLFKKLVKWDIEIEKILFLIQMIKSKIIPSIQQKLNFEFKDHNKIILALFSKSTKNIFKEMNKERFIKKRHAHILNTDKLNHLASLGEIAEGLATLGDKVLGLAAIHIIWEKGLFKKGDITREKKNLEKNSKLAKIFDDLNLEQAKISIAPKNEGTKIKTINHEKGTIMEAIFWIIYSENGLSNFINILNNF
jgi:dsRNA-specific ribonuclease